MYHTATVKGGCFIRPVLFCGEIPQEIKQALASLGYDVFCLSPSTELPEPVRCHPDMLMAELPTGKLLITERYYRQNETVLSPYQNAFVLTNDTLGATYPDDVRLNALAIGDTLYCGKSASRTLQEAYRHVVTVKQGYTHCAACRVGRGIITADRTLYDALVKNGVEALLISSGNIALPPYDTGFIGGASLFLSDSLTCFFGKVEAHPDYEAMAAFAETYGSTLLSLSDEPLADFGGGYLLSE